MKATRFLNTIPFLAALAWIAAVPATASCGGDQLTLNFEEIKLDCGPAPLPLTVHTLEHNLDDHVRADPDRYAPADVAVAHANLAAFEEMAGSVRRLVTRAERLTDPAEADVAFRVAENLLRNLPIAEYLTVDDFVEENRNYSAVGLSFDVLLRYLRDVGTAEELVVAIEDSAPEC